LANDEEGASMGLFEKRRRPTDLEQVDTWDGADGAAADIIIDLARTEPVPVVAREGGRARSRPAPTGRYDPTQPGQTPVSGVDLVTFAVLSRRLHERPPHAHAKLLASYGHTTTSWSAVTTVWMARMGQQPFLYAVFEDAFGSA
jgi:hypothetical protein